MIYLALGTNVGNKFQNLRTAIAKLSDFFDCRKSSIVIETEAMLLPESPEEWRISYLNMVIAGNSLLDPFELLRRIKNVEKEMGRDLNAPRWSPRIIDIDIVDYNGEVINTDSLSTPHKEIQNRDFLQYLLWSIDYYSDSDSNRNGNRDNSNTNSCVHDIAQISIQNISQLSNYKALNYATLNPKLVGIVNITPDSFSDGGKYLCPDAAVEYINDIYKQGACVIELGAQSTRPNYKEIPPSEEIARLGEILERTKDIGCIGIDTYFDEVVKYAIRKYDLKWINDTKSMLSPKTIKLIADNDVKLVIMLHGIHLSWLKDQANRMHNLGMKKKNIIIDPGIGFSKNRLENIQLIKNISIIKDFGYEVMFAHSRKSFISCFSNEIAAHRDIETLAISDFAVAQKMDYLRVHNVKDHMKFFVAKQIIAT